MKQRIFGWISIGIGILLALATAEVTAIAWLYTCVEQGTANSTWHAKTATDPARRPGPQLRTA